MSVFRDECPNGSISKSLKNSKSANNIPMDPLTSNRLIYRAIDLPGDEDFFLTIRQDHEAYQLASHDILVPQNRQSMTEFLSMFKETSLIATVICLQGPTTDGLGTPLAPTPIGWIRLKAEAPAFRHHRRSEIGISIVREYRGQGYGSEAISWAPGWGFKTAGLHRIGITTFEFNHRACKLYDRLGFVREGVRRESIFCDGKWWGEYEWSLLKQEWMAMQDKVQVETAPKPSNSSGWEPLFE